MNTVQFSQILRNNLKRNSCVFGTVGNNHSNIIGKHCKENKNYDETVFKNEKETLNIFELI